MVAIARSFNTTYQGVLYQTDTYFNVLQGRLKLREITNHTSELIYYNRKENTSTRLSNYIIYSVNNEDELKNILDISIGTKAIVRKKRELFIYKSARIHIDDVVSLGCFMEIEVPVLNDVQYSESILSYLVDKFLIKESDFFNHSYVDIMIETSNSSFK